MNQTNLESKEDTIFLQGLSIFILLLILSGGSLYYCGDPDRPLPTGWLYTMLTTTQKVIGPLVETRSTSHVLLPPEPLC